jgi:hypothetical protein
MWETLYSAGSDKTYLICWRHAFSSWGRRGYKEIVRPDESFGRASFLAMTRKPQFSRKFHIFVINTMSKQMAMNELIFLVEEAPEGGFTAKALGESIYTEADTMDELKKMIREAISCHFDKEVTPQIIRLHFVKEELLPL